MSSVIRKKSRKQKRTVAKIILARGKRIRLFLLCLGMLPIVFSLWYKGEEDKPAPTEKINALDTSSFAHERVKVDKALTLVKEGARDLPVRILIPDLDIDLTVKEAKVVDGFWEVFPTGAAWGSGSGIPGEAGNQVIFAHAREGMFLPLKQAKVNQSIYIFTKDKWYSYKIREITEVLPDNLAVISPTDDETLTLYTCTGSGDARRFIVKAKRV
ncbi:MAG: Sortase family protein [Candidatus Gottesmanbacteria bacterium GW2011_GWC2_39_8]|uniref:Sortase family protein n=1 Tax=Candidatus Gottesmanbacteria bacterium GW2011_GWC2_39_8 TaxID=1618450 RepID=A0A0G0SAC9_9BACT|nr:MAG: Sortase family protein [Candidatus Gottesmanbacteria bacterium GW2011_GWC2_39_8]